MASSIVHEDGISLMQSSARSRSSITSSTLAEDIIQASRNEKRDPFLVKFGEDEPDNPQNWSRSKKRWLTILASLLALNATFASAAPSLIIEQIEQAFGFSQEVGSLVVAIFIAGYCCGPICQGPLSEQVGRRPVLLVSFLCYTGFQVGCALSKNTESVLIFRLLSGIFAAAPLTVSGGIISDIWDAKTRGIAMTWFSAAPFAGPFLGPTARIGVGSWVLTIFAGSCFILILFFLTETYPPVLLTRKAKWLRKTTGDVRYHSPLEMGHTKLGLRVKNILIVPFQLLFLEPVLVALTIYMSFMYGCIYLLFEFTEGHNLDAGVSGLIFLPVTIGGILYIIVYVPRYNTTVDKYAPHPVPAEKRLEVTLLAAPLFLISLFWFGWTSYPWIPLWSPMFAGGLMGFSILLISFSLLDYIVDTYTTHAATALSSNTIVRSAFGAAFPLFARQMFEGLNPRWASTLLGCFAGIMMPIPYLLINFGPALRRRSKFTPTISNGIPERAPADQA
ncbi:major facilitator superfamily domain-containing protein [Vararia minispora EC-137]|uniref:Major facilitator superfamily domain-containing protein n=1 Tax=Vararia minispora EC-137 TaxID=1314806 RepID=A0ACB8QQT2_9AGAM|nr:major facilitator superfamily domain-containing protein [Vararia minispora EC-137]